MSYRGRSQGLANDLVTFFSHGLTQQRRVILAGHSRLFLLEADLGTDNSRHGFQSVLNRPDTMLTGHTFDSEQRFHGLPFFHPRD